MVKLLDAASSMSDLESDSANQLQYLAGWVIEPPPIERGADYLEE